MANKARPRLFQSYLPAAVSRDRLPFGSVLAPRFAFRLKPDIAGLIRTAQAERNAMIPLKTVSRPQPSIRHAGLPRRWVAIDAEAASQCPSNTERQSRRARQREERASSCQAALKSQQGS